MFIQFTDIHNQNTITVNSNYIIRITQARTTDRWSIIPHEIEIFVWTKGWNGSNDRFNSTEHHKISDSDYENIVNTLLHSN